MGEGWGARGRGWEDAAARGFASHGRHCPEHLLFRSSPRSFFMHTFPVCCLELFLPCYLPLEHAQHRGRVARGRCDVQLVRLAQVERTRLVAAHIRRSSRARGDHHGRTTAASRPASTRRHCRERVNTLTRTAQLGLLD